MVGTGLGGPERESQIPKTQFGKEMQADKKTATAVNTATFLMDFAMVWVCIFRTQRIGLDWQGLG